MLKLISRAVAAALAVGGMTLGNIIEQSQSDNLYVAPVSQPIQSVERANEPETIVEEDTKVSAKTVERANEPETIVEEDTKVSAKSEPAVDTSRAVLPKSTKTAADMAKTTNETVFTTMASQVGAPWGLDKLDGTRDNTYNYISDGTGVRIYIVDTGVDATHREFGSRVIDGYDAFGENLDQTDCDGHGTHVAGIAAGNYYGVAKAATIVPVRVMDCNGVGNTTTLTSGINWILANHSGGTGIVNMSIGGPKDELVDSAVSRLVSAGMIVVAAAGNSNVDACGISPASAPGVIAVGATDQSDVKTSFSNWGQCVDISAPGDRINSANAADDNISLRMSGTSQASPFVAGAIATYLSSGSLSAPSQAQSYAQELAVGGVVRVESEPEPSVEPSPEPIVEPEPAPPEPEPSPSPVVNEPILPDYEVSISAVADGPMFGLLQWTYLDSASGYRVYRTSSSRPSWRIYGDFPGNSYTEMLIVTDIGKSALYKVVAIIDSQEVEIGKIKHRPTE